MHFLIYAINFTLLFSFLLDVYVKDADRRFSFGLIRIFFIVSVLAAEYLYLGADMQGSLVGPLFFSENVFALIWMMLAFNLRYFMNPDEQASRFYRIAPLAAIVIGSILGGYWIIGKTRFSITAGEIFFATYGGLFFSSLFLLVAVLINAWRLEAFWRALESKLRKQFKDLLIGFFLIAGSVGWSASFRLTYLHLKRDHLLLLSVLLFVAWFIVGYAIAASRLLNRKIFVSRKIVYSSVAPFAFALYLILLGLISLLMRTFGWSLNFVLQWLIIIAGLLAVAALGFSQRIRARIKYFVSTHFYINKYEYRDEWLAFSDLLHRRLTEKGVVDALRHILHDSLYTDIIKIWLADGNGDCRLIDVEAGQGGLPDVNLSAGNSLVQHLKTIPHLYFPAPLPGSENERIIHDNKAFFSSMGVVLLVPLSIGDHFLGIIGLGPEYTGGNYGKDDFDLLSALSSQAASALLAVRTAEELARSREQNAWHALSAFVLHDIKNAANLLNLVRENADAHMHDPEFQQDMLGSIDDALKRMAKVQVRLNALKGEMLPDRKALDAVHLLRSCCDDLAKKLPELQIEVQSQFEHFQTSMDPEFFYSILENLLLNSLEAGGKGARVLVRLAKSKVGELQVEVTDNGPGIPPDLLPDRLFEPFKTSREKGSGIGLWQVRQFVESLGGNIEARNLDGQGAQFIIRLPSIYAQ